MPCSDNSRTSKSKGHNQELRNEEESLRDRENKEVLMKAMLLFWACVFSTTHKQCGPQDKLGKVEVTSR